MLLQAVVGACLETPKYFSVVSLNLSIALWIDDRCVTDLDVKVFIVLLKQSASELGPMVSDDTVLYPEPIDDLIDKLDSRFLVDLDYRSCFWPLCELVDGDIHVPISSDGPGERSRMSSPHMANDHEGGIICSICAGVWIYLAWN
jgi:hypothetical protein